MSLGRASAPLGADARSDLSERVGPSSSGLRPSLRHSPKFSSKDVLADRLSHRVPPSASTQAPAITNFGPWGYRPRAIAGTLRKMTDRPDRPKLTRRGLLRGFGTVTVIAGCTKPAAEGTSGPAASNNAENPPEDTAQVGPGPGPLQFQVNGVQKTLEIPAETTLLAALRDHLGLTGSKEVCDRGACGACMVLVDGIAMNSCMMLAHDAENRAITTVEGLASDGGLAPLQAACIAHDAAQCGFCTSGMLISATALLRSSGAIGGPQIARAMAGNLCRCGSYPHMLAAIQEVADAQGKA